MKFSRLLFVLVAGASVAQAAGCSGKDDPASYVTGLRVLAIKAEPPEIPIGGTSTLSTLAIDTEGTPIVIDWAQCLDPPLEGEAINPDCITHTTADYLHPVGRGLSVTTTMPQVDPTLFGRPDASGGIYLPLIAQVSASPAALTASYQLRLDLGSPPNRNPTLGGLYRVIGNPDGGTAPAVLPIDEQHPLVVHAGEEVTLRATFMPGSAESYQVYDGDPKTTPPRKLTETLSVSWFSSAGDFSAAASGADVPDTVFHLDQTSDGPSLHLPASGTAIDLWIVGRDERGGTDYLHRTLDYE